MKKFHKRGGQPDFISILDGSGDDLRCFVAFWFFRDNSNKSE